MIWSGANVLYLDCGMKKKTILLKNKAPLYKDKGQSVGGGCQF